MGHDDADWAVSFAIPMDAPGLTLYVSPYLHGEPNGFRTPDLQPAQLLRPHRVRQRARPQGTVFLNRQPELAGPLALAFVDYHRFTAVNYKLPVLDLLVGAAIEMAQPTASHLPVT